MNRYIGFGKSTYGVTGDPYLQVVKGSRDLLLEFWDPYISGTVETRNFKFGTHMNNEGYEQTYAKLGKRGS